MKKTTEERNDFILPDELGWEANDEIHAIMQRFLNMWVELASEGELLAAEILIAEYSDNIYAAIKRYQEAK